MYENGRQVNRYAAKQIHRDKVKRKFTPYWFSSYEAYVAFWEDDKIPNSSSYQRAIDSGWVPWHRRWWNGHGSQFPWKKHLKEDAHIKARAHYRQELAHYDIEEDNIDMQKKFSDPWCWD